MAFSQCWQSARSAPVRPRLAQLPDASMKLPLVRTRPPSEPRKAISGLPGAKAITCWSGCIPSGGDSASLVMSVKLTPASVQRSTDAGVSFTDMTNDAESPPLGMHPDQHVIAFAPGSPDIAFLGSDGGLVRTSGNFIDASGSCASRGLTGADLTDCQNWLKAIPTQIFSLNDGLATIQFQSLTFNPQHPHTDIIGGSQDNGTWAYSANPTSWFESVGGD